MEQSGIVTNVLQAQTINGRNGAIVKNFFVITWSDNGYEKKICFEVIGEERWEKMKQSVVVGNAVNVSFDVTSREWNGKWFTSCTAFRCLAVGASKEQAQTNAQAPQQPQQAQSPVPNAQVATQNAQASNNADALPF